MSIPHSALAQLRVAAKVAGVQLFSIALNPEERNELLVNYAGAIIYTIQPDGTMTYVSPNWSRDLGHAAEDVVGCSFSHFVHPDDHPACYAFLGRIVGTGAPEGGIEYRVLHADGRQFWHTSTIIPVKPQDGGINNPHFPAYRSGHRLFQRPSPQKQFPSIP